MTAKLLPQTFWFRYAFPCPRLQAAKSGAARGAILDLPESCRLPQLAELEGRAAWSEARAAWNEAGLALQFSVTGKTTPITYDPVLPEASDGVQVWIDTRDTRDIHRASRFCHRYSALLRRSNKGVDVLVEHRRIHRAAGEPGGIRPHAVRAEAQVTRNGWRINLFFPSESLHGFEPDVNRRLGFYYQITEPSRGAEYLAVGSDFPITEDPSLWATLELVDTPPPGE